MDGVEAESQAWPFRAAMLALLGALGGFAIYLLFDHADRSVWAQARYAAATFIGIALLAFGHGWVRGRLLWAAGMAVIAGAVVAMVFLWNGTPTEDWSGGESWRIVAALLAVFLFVPMAQAGGGSQGFRAPSRWSPSGFGRWVEAHFDYAAVHEHGWTNLIIAGLSVLFAGLFFLMALLVGALFDLVQVSFLKKLLQEEAVIAVLFGDAIGGSTGLLRDHRRIISALQGVAMTVLRMAAPVLAVALALFLMILPLTGLAPLWDATRSTTPILLCAVVIALVLANSVVGNGETGEVRAPVLRGAAVILALVPAPLVLIAAISTGLRVGQYGWTPERLWAATFILMACIIALAYLATVVRARGRWAEGIRATNLHLAFLICAVAFLLSTPLIRFDAIATRDQVARLEDGRTPAGKFDYHALWFEFGPAGKAAIRRLAATGATADIRRDARAVQAVASRWAPDPTREARRRGGELDARLTILPGRVALPPELRAALARFDICGSAGPCTVRYEEGADVAVVVHDPAVNGNAKARPLPGIFVLVRDGREWKTPAETTSDGMADMVQADAVRAGRVEVRTELYRRLYIDGKPFDRPFPRENAADPRSAP